VRSLVISDLHSNEEALTAVLKKVRRKRIDRIICLGDFVGYGAQPNQVLDVMRNFKARKLYIRGNHDRAAAGIDDAEGFNHAAKAAVFWTRDRLSRPNQRFLETLPTGPRAVDQGALLVCHGSPFDEDEYLFSDILAAEIFSQVKSSVILYGHTHLPAIFTLTPEGEVVTRYVRSGGTFLLQEGMRYLINPGSVGQPRDRNPRASFLLLDDQARTVQFIRVDYQIEVAQMAILRAGLPRILADRLAVGT
jgi:predicted phosphodiesterase